MRFQGPPSSKPPSRRAFPALDPRSAATRLVLALAVGSLTTVLLAPKFGWAVCAVSGWDAGALTLVALAWLIIGRADSAVKAAYSTNPQLN